MGFLTSSITTANSWFGAGTAASTPSYSFAKDSRGRPMVATMADVNAATKPGDKLTVAAQVAESVRLQTDTALKTGRADRLADMTKQAQQVMDAVSSVVDSLKSTPAVSGTDPALKSYQSKIAKVLTSLAGSLPTLKALTSRASREVAATTNSSLQTMDTTAATIAKLAGSDWKSIKTSTASAGTAASTTPRLVDFLA